MKKPQCNLDNLTIKEIYLEYGKKVLDDYMNLRYSLWWKIKRTLGLKGSWDWALRQMRNGKIVYLEVIPKAKFKLSNDGNLKVLQSLEGQSWENAVLFFYDFKSGNWAVSGQ